MRPAESPSPPPRARRAALIPPMAVDILSLEEADFTALGVVEHAERLYLPTKVRRRDAKGGLVEDPVLIVEPTNAQRFQSRIDAKSYCSQIRGGGLDREEDKDYFEQIENVALLSYALRDPATRGQLEPDVESLLARYPDSTLAELWGQLNKWCEMLDPRFGKMSAEELWQVVAGLSRGNILPLVAMPTYAQSTCFVLMAKEASSSPNAPSWLTSPETSPSDASEETSSSPASGKASSPSDE